MNIWSEGLKTLGLFLERNFEPNGSGHFGLKCSRPLVVSVLKTRPPCTLKTNKMSVKQVAAPMQVPDSLKALVDQLEEPAKRALDMFQIPYWVQSQLAVNRWTKYSDLACIWNDPQEARQQAPGDLGYGAEGDYNDNEKRTISMRMYQVVTKAQLDYKLMQGQGSEGAKPQTPGMQLMLGYSKRRQMEANYKRITGKEPPSIEKQGSDKLVERVWNFMEQNNCGFVELKHVCPQVPTLTDVVKSAKRTEVRADGLHHQIEEEWARPPEDMKAWKDRLQIWRNTYMMVSCCFEQYAALQVPEKVMDDFYDHLMGPLLAERQSNPIPLKVLMTAEREAWKHVTVAFYKGQPVAETLRKIRDDSLFWTAYTSSPEVSRKRTLGEQDGLWTPPKRSRAQRRAMSREYARGLQGAGSQGSQFPSQDASKGGGKGKSKGKKSKGDGKGGKKQGGAWPGNWAKKDQNGKKFCAAYHLSNSCRFGKECRDSHKCPVQKDGWICNKPGHTPANCPMLRG